MPDGDETVRLARHAMRTRWEIALPADGRLSAEARRAAGEEALREIECVEGLLSVYRPDADLFAVNARAAREAVPVDARTFAFLRRAAELTTLTGGAFDLTVGPLLRLWGLGGEGGASIPADAEIAQAREWVGMASVVTLDADAQTVAFAREGVRLDAGAMGKGWAADRAALLLAEAGVTNALLHGGTSTVAAIGAGEGGDGWPVAVRHPALAAENIAVVRLRDMALSVSATHGKTAGVDGVTWGHVINPVTGRPVDRNLLAAVVAPSAADTDCLSTALLAFGPDALADLSACFPQAAFLVIYRGDGGSLECAIAGRAVWDAAGLSH